MGNPHACVVLLRAVNTIRKLVVRGDSVKLSSRLIVVGCPVFTAIIGDLRTTIIGNYHSQIIRRVNPKVMVIAMGCVLQFKGLSPIF